MFTKFKTASFIAKTVTGLEVERNVLHILTTGASYQVRYETNDEAIEGLSELTDILNQLNNDSSTKNITETTSTESTESSVKSTFTEGLNRLQDMLESVQKEATAKVQTKLAEQILGTAGKTLGDIMGHKDDLLARAQSLFEKLEETLDDKEEPVPMATRNKSNSGKRKQEETKQKEVQPSILQTDCIFTSTLEVPANAVADAKKIGVEEFKKIFGTPAEPAIGDMSERQVREFISAFVDGALSNERVQELFNNIKENFGENEAEGAIEGYKNLILTIALQNVEMTLSDIIAKYFS